MVVAKPQVVAPNDPRVIGEAGHKLGPCEPGRELVQVGLFQVLEDLLPIDDAIELGQGREEERLEVVGGFAGDHRIDHLIEVEVTETRRLSAPIDIVIAPRIGEENATKRHDVTHLPCEGRTFAGEERRCRSAGRQWHLRPLSSRPPSNEDLRGGARRVAADARRGGVRLPRSRRVPGQTPESKPPPSRFLCPRSHQPRRLEAGFIALDDSTSGVVALAEDQPPSHRARAKHTVPRLVANARMSGPHRAELPSNADARR